MWIWWDFRSSYNNNWVLISSSLIWIFLLASFSVRMSLSSSKLFACLKSFLYIFHNKLYVWMCHWSFCKFEIVFLTAMYFLEEKVTFIVIFIWFAFFYGLLPWFYVFFFLLEFKLTEGRSLSKLSPKENSLEQIFLDLLNSVNSKIDKIPSHIIMWEITYFEFWRNIHILKGPFLVTLKKASEYMF